MYMLSLLYEQQWDIKVWMGWVDWTMLWMKMKSGWQIEENAMWSLLQNE